MLGVDIGGTKIAAGLVDGEARVRSAPVTPTRASEGYAVAIEQVHRAIAGALNDRVRAIGICAPGPLNPKTGVIWNPPNLPGWRDVPLAELVSARYGLPCRVENDANAAGLAEAKFGAGRGFETVFYATISTGIGAGIVLNQRVHHGRTGGAGEGGHVTIDYRSPVICNCGTPGCIEVLASGTAMTAHRLPLEEICIRIAAWLGSVISLLDPDVIVLGGGVTKHGNEFFARIREEVPQRTINRFASGTPIVPAELGDNVGVVGAASLFLE